MSAPKWAKGMERIAPGLYVDADGAAHFYPYEVCLAEGVPPNAHNIRMLEQAAADGFRKAAIEAGQPPPVIHDVKDE